MTLPLDPEFAAALAARMELTGPPPPPAPAGDAVTRRRNVDELLGTVAAQLGLPPGMRVETAEADGPDGPVPLHVLRPEGAGPGIVVYVHGGGMIAGRAEPMLPLAAPYADAAKVTMVSVDYRLAPEDPFPAGAEDCYAGLVWAAAHARELGADPARLAVMGESAGGGLAAAVALMARDRGGPAIDRQLLVYPMLDDRTLTPHPTLVDAPLVWTYDDNVTGWGALLGEGHETRDDVSPYAAPARAGDLSGLPEAYIEVGNLDIFRDEDIAYAARLTLDGVPTELHVRPGLPHGFELVGPGVPAVARAVADRRRFLSALNRP